MEIFLFIAIPLAIGYFVYKAYRKEVISRREELIDTFIFPPSIAGKITEKYPQLSEQQAAEVMHGLREYFHLCNLAGYRMVSMPSQVVDVAWHEFILFPRKYEHFCSKALGRFLHHTPAEAMSAPDGFKYSLNCTSTSGNSTKGNSGYCAGHIGCTSGCGGDSSGCGGDSSGCGGGCGGD